MTETNALSLPEGMGESIVKYSQEDIAEMSKSGDWLPRVQIMGSNSDLVQNQKLDQGIFALVFDQNRYFDMGKEMDIAIYTMRPKALRIAGDGIFQYYDRKNPEFEKIKVDSQVKDSGCMYGLEFLIYVPSKDTLATFYCGSKSGRREAPSILTIMNKGTPEEPKYEPAPVTITTHFIPKTSNRKFSWWSFLATPCTSPLTDEPDSETLRKEIEKFNNPPESKVEKVETAAAGIERER